MSRLLARLRQSPRAMVRDVRGAWEAATNRTENAAHWAAADSKSIAADATPAVRAALRIKARHEVKNNEWAKGVVGTLVDHVVGIGPQILCVEDIPDEQAEALEADFQEWWEAPTVAGTERLQIARRGKATDGEAFVQVINNLEAPYGIGLANIEADQIDDPTGSIQDSPLPNDGVTLDLWGNPLSYSLLTYHPGDGRGVSTAIEIPARFISQWITRERPSQLRGVCELAAALERFAVLRRFIHASLRGAEILASQALTVETTFPPAEDADILAAGSEFPITPGAVTALPEGYKLSGVSQTMPNPQFEPFVDALLAGIGRVLNIPFVLVKGSAAGFNYSSARFDLVAWKLRVRVEREECQRQVMAPIWREWFTVRALSGELPPAVAALGRLPRVAWTWQGMEHVDPQKEADAEDKRLRSGTASYSSVLGAQGKDWRRHYRQLARERAKRAELGLPEFGAAPAAPPAPAPAPSADDGEDPPE